MIIFLYGEDSYRSRQKLNKIRDKFLKQDPTGMNLTVLDASGDNYSLENFRKAITTVPFLGDSRLIVVENLLSKTGEAKEVAEFLKDQKVPEATVLIFHEGAKVDKRQVLFKTLQKKARSEEFPLMAGAQLQDWAGQEIVARGGKIEPAALTKLTAAVGADLWRLSNEIDKLMAFRHKGVIKESDVSLLVKAQIDTSIFELTDAIGQRDQRQALKLLHQHLSQGESALYLLTMIVYQFRNLTRLKDLIERGRDQQTIVRETKLHPFVVQKTMQQARNYDSRKLRDIYQKLLNTDVSMKTTQRKPEMLLDVLILDLTNQ